MQIPEQTQVSMLAKAMIVDSEAFAVVYLQIADIALKLDTSNPTLPGAFTGTSSERIARQLAALNAAGF